MTESNVRLPAGVARATERVAMRDGIRLATDVYLPAGNGPFPVLMERTPYGRNADARRERSVARPAVPLRGDVAARFCAHGYAVVVQDCRGRFDSEGRFTKYLGEADDGADTMDWLLRQPWCNGKVGTYGLSYAAHTQTALASRRPRGLAAMFIEAGGFANAWRGGIRHGGAFELKQATWAHRQTEAGAGEDIEAWFRRLPWRRGDSPLAAAPETEDWLFEQWERGRFDDYWRQPELYAAGHYDAFDGIPVALMCGWWDPYAQTTTDNYTGISRRPGGLARMILGPWTHGERSVTHAGDVDFGPEAVLDGVLAPDYLQLRVAWFDRWLKGVPAAQDDPAVRYFRMGGGTGERDAQGRRSHGGVWRTAGDWPVPGTEFVPWHLQADGSLAPQPAAQAHVFEYVFDPANPVPTCGGSVTSGEPLMVAGAYDQGPAHARPDVLSFVSAPLKHDLEVTGPVFIRLWVSSDAPDTDFTAKLIDVYPDGFAMNLTDGILRCRYRQSPEAPRMLERGEVVEITIEPMPTSNLFRAGHRIRLDVSSSNFPRFDVNPNTGAPEGGDGPRVKARNRVHIGAAHASHVLLPVVA